MFDRFVTVVGGRVEGCHSFCPTMTSAIGLKVTR